MTKPKTKIELVKDDLYHVFHGYDWELLRYKGEGGIRSQSETEHPLHIFRSVIDPRRPLHNEGRTVFVKRKDVVGNVRPASAEINVKLNELHDRIKSLEDQIKETKMEITELADPL